VNIAKVVPNINKHLDESKPYIKPNKNSHLGLNVPEIIFEYGSIKSKLKSIPNIRKYLVGSIKELKKSYSEIYNQPINPSITISKKDLDDLRIFLDEIGIDEIAFTSVPNSFIFSNKKIIYKNAIILLMEMKSYAIKLAPSKETEKEIFRTYYELNVAVNKLKRFLNDRGYNAEAGPALGGEVNYPLLAQKAAMGCIGKNGMLITEKFGPSIRLATVYTDIENLPKETENTHMWINEFCDKCNQCVRKCPASAIHLETKVFEDGSKQCIDYKKCAVPFSRDNGCTVCIKECTVFKSGYGKVKSAYMEK